MLNAVRHLLLLAAVAVALPVHAEEARQRRAEASERIREVERDGGRVLRAERVQRGGEETYRLKVLTPEGRVRVLHGDDARESRDAGRFERRGLQGRERMRRPEPRPADAGRGEPAPDPGRRDRDD
ncbi:MULTISPECIES: hypothetical protein [unclassified Arenimonas]|uniref:hypothetical protein n=1 Tax=unclassified Arenimonas TaxID=2641713 RepID=UPI0008689261|nr:MULTISPECIES: hypothetical protein [unclassified Arenimonas]ODS64098.1 MAG: hypothetical protein ABS41_03555 [Arenimonas sp. SCN 70-307]